MREARVIKAAPNEDGAAWANALADLTWRDGAELLKRDGGVSVWRTNLCGKDVVVKCWSLSRARRRTQSIFGATPAVRHWRGAAWLESHGFLTATTYALVRLDLDGDPHECLVMRSISGKSVLHHLEQLDLDVVQEHAIAGLLGEQVASMIAAGRYNRDHKPSNLIVSFDERGKPEVSIIDAVAIRRVFRTWDRLCGMLADLIIEPTGCGCPPKRTLAFRASLVAMGRVGDSSRKASAETKWRIRDAWGFAGREISRRGVLTPRVDPLARVRRTDG